MIFGLLTYDIFNVFHISSMGKEHVLRALFIRHVNLKQSRHIAGLNYYFSVDQYKTANPNKMIIDADMGHVTLHI